ncbi:hypothetical protein GJAV_G00146910 [Gymnothorax javanicus]|nr:hypothetical protein GJAV_G00146910 [Gymnothorax javanicus]
MPAITCVSRDPSLVKPSAALRQEYFPQHDYDILKPISKWQLSRRIIRCCLAALANGSLFTFSEYFYSLLRRRKGHERARETVRGGAPEVSPSFRLSH